MEHYLVIEYPLKEIKPGIKATPGFEEEDIYGHIQSKFGYDDDFEWEIINSQVNNDKLTITYHIFVPADDSFHNN